MGRPKKYVYEAGDVIARGWTYVREGRGGSGNRWVFVLCPSCGAEVERSLGTLFRADRPDKGLVSCGCDLRERHAHRYAASPSESAVRGWMASARGNARSRGHVFDLTFADVEALIFKECRYCGTPATAGSSVARRNYLSRDVAINGLDRVDPSIGYTPGNVVPCCATCNYMKRTMGLEEFLEQIRRIHAHLGM